MLDRNIQRSKFFSKYILYIVIILPKKNTICMQFEFHKYQFNNLYYLLNV